MSNFIKVLNKLTEAKSESEVLEIKITKLQKKIEDTRNMYPTPNRKLKLKKMNSELEQLKASR